jgi:hypothetical protein
MISKSAIKDFAIRKLEIVESECGLLSKSRRKSVTNFFVKMGQFHNAQTDKYKGYDEFLKTHEIPPEVLKAFPDWIGQSN